MFKSSATPVQSQLVSLPPVVVVVVVVVVVFFLDVDVPFVMLLLSFIVCPISTAVLNTSNNNSNSNGNNKVTIITIIDPFALRLVEPSRTGEKQT